MNTRLICKAADRGRRWLTGFAVTLLVGAAASGPAPATAEYGDVVLNRTSEAEGMAPVVFPHWFHRIRFRCNVCHTELDFEMRVGANPMDMSGMTEGQYCGACHDGQIAWGLDQCVMCHSGKPGLTTRIQGGHETSGPGRW